MNAIVQMIMSQLSGDAIGNIAKQLGIKPEIATRAVNAAVPLILSALARNAANKQGASSLLNALKKDHDGSILDNVMDFLGNASAGPGAGILKHIFGQERSTVEKQLSQTIGLEPKKTSKVMEMVAPLVMGALGRATLQEGLNAKSLAQFLDLQKQQVAQQQPDVFGTISKLLDQDGDGSPLNDLGNVLGKLFKK